MKARAIPPVIRLILLLATSLVSSCSLESEPVLDQAAVIVNSTSVRAEPSSSSRTLFRLAEGERVSILEKSGTWYRVLDKDSFEGWMDESTLLRDSTAARMEIMLEESRPVPSQNTVTTVDEVNLRLEPGRDTAIVRRLRRGVALEVVDWDTTPRPGTDATDVWLKVRSDTEIGWVYRPLVDFAVPDALAPYTEERIYTAVIVLEEVVDPEAGPVRWYVVGERRASSPPEVAYEGIRVFTWNLAAHRYETSLRLRDLDGLYPVEITATDPPGFRFHVRGLAGTPEPREYVMRGTVPRRVALQ